MNYYQTLGVQRDASTEQIKSAYRKLAKEHHPDRNGDPVKFKEITDAYDNLMDPNKRQRYDNPVFHQGHTLEDLLRQFKSDNWSQDFDQSFGQGARGSDVRMQFTLDVNEQYNGASRTINFGNETFTVNIPPGAFNGQKLRIAQKGQPHPYNSVAPRGDLIITIYILPNPDLIVNGNDIHIDLALPFWDLLLGVESEISTPFQKFKVKIPSNSYDGKILRIQGKGMPIWNSNLKGSMIIKLRSAPVELKDDEIELIKTIKRNYEQFL